MGHSSRKRQILKFAFICTLVALAAMKTLDKVEWMVEPTVAPWVLEPPFSALEPKYQGSVAPNLASQTTQLVPMISYVGQGKKVSDALESFVGKHYVSLSKTMGMRGDKPVKTMVIKGSSISSMSMTSIVKSRCLEEVMARPSLSINVLCLETKKN